jgi:hypothetical protein
MNSMGFASDDLKKQVRYLSKKYSIEKIRYNLKRVMSRGKDPNKSVG